MGFEICNFSDLKEGNAIFEKMRKSIDFKRLSWKQQTTFVASIW